MNIDSVERGGRHISNVQRIKAELSILSEHDKQKRIDSEKELASIRWITCRKGFAMLFMALNRGNHFPEDDFVVKVDSKVYSKETYDTYMRVWRSKDHQTYNAKPFVKRDEKIRDDDVLDTESFGRTFDYPYGTYHSHSARVVFDSDEGVLPNVRLERIDGILVDEMSDNEYAILLGVLESEVMPSIDFAEDTLTLISEAVLNRDYNPVLAERLRLDLSKHRPTVDTSLMTWYSHHDD